MNLIKKSVSSFDAHSALAPGPIFSSNTYESDLSANLLVKIFEVSAALKRSNMELTREWNGVISFKSLKISDGSIFDVKITSIFGLL